MANKRQRQGEASTLIFNTSKSDVTTPKFTTKIEDVYYDCLEHVFNYLNLEDLMNLADAIKAIRRDAATFFANKHKGKCIKVEPNNNKLIAVSVEDQSISIHKLTLASKIIRLFGKSITKIQITYNCILNGGVKCYFIRQSLDILRKRLMLYINKYCSKTLKTLILVGPIYLSIAEAKTAYENLEELSLIGGCIGFNASQFNEFFPNLRKMELFRCCFDDPHGFVATYQHLEHLRIYFLRFAPSSFKMDNVKEILNLNPQLKTFGYFDDCKLTFLKYINQKLKQLKTLELNIDEVSSRKPVSPVNLKYVENLKLFSNEERNLDKTKLGDLLSLKQLKCMKLYNVNDLMTYTSVERGFSIYLQRRTVGRCICKFYNFHL